MSSDAAYSAEAMWCLDSGTLEERGGVSDAAPYDDLLIRIRADDADAFKALIVSLAQPLERYAFRFSTSGDAAKDVVQDVFAHIWAQRHSLHVRGNFRTYLYAAVRNRALDVRKHRAAETARF